MTEENEPLKESLKKDLVDVGVRLEQARSQFLQLIGIQGYLQRKIHDIEKPTEKGPTSPVEDKENDNKP